MCSAAGAAVGLTALQAGMQYQASEMQIEGIKRTAHFNADQLEKKALRVQQVMGEREGDADRQRGQVREHARAVIGAGQAGFAANNVLVASGSSLDWQMGIEGDVQQDVQQIGINLERELRSLEAVREDLLSDASFEHWRGETGVAATRMQQWGIPLQAGTQIAAMYA